LKILPIKNFGKIRPTSVEYAIIALDKIGMPRNNPWYGQIISIIETNIELYTKEDPNDSNDLPENLRSSWMVRDNKTLFVNYDEHYGWNFENNNGVDRLVNFGYEYQGEIKVEPYEISSYKFRI
jgi:hypothetical protein